MHRLQPQMEMGLVRVQAFSSRLQRAPVVWDHSVVMAGLVQHKAGHDGRAERTRRAIAMQLPCPACAQTTEQRALYVKRLLLFEPRVILTSVPYRLS